MQFHQFLTQKEPLKTKTFEEMQKGSSYNRKLNYYKENLKTNYMKTRNSGGNAFKECPIKPIPKASYMHKEEPLFPFSSFSTKM